MPQAAWYLTANDDAGGGTDHVIEALRDRVDVVVQDTARLAGLDPHLLGADDTGRDSLADLGTQTRNGLSVRSLQTILVFSKALAYFRGATSVGVEDVRHVVPFVLVNRLVQDRDAAFFDAEGNAAYRADRIGWIRRLFDLSCAQYDLQGLDADDPAERFITEFDLGLEGVSERQVRDRLVHIERTLAAWSSGRKLYGTVYDDILAISVVMILEGCSSVPGDPQSRLAAPLTRGSRIRRGRSSKSQAA